MHKIATPQELQTGLLSILAYVQGSENPERTKIAADLRELADRVAATDVTAAVPSQVKRLTRMVRNEGVEEKGHEVLVKFKTERDANKFEDRAKGALGLDDDDDDDDSKYDVWGTQDPKSGMYTIHISF